MNDLDALLKLVDAFAAHTGLADATISTRFFGRGTRIAELRAGGDMGSRTIRQIVERLSDEWPEGAEWPASVARPVRESFAEAAE